MVGVKQKPDKGLRRHVWGESQGDRVAARWISGNSSLLVHDGSASRNTQIQVPLVCRNRCNQHLPLIREIHGIEMERAGSIKVTKLRCLHLAAAAGPLRLDIKGARRRSRRYDGTVLPNL